MSNKLFVVDFCHVSDEQRGRYERLETVYHLHNEYENFRCKLIDDQYVCVDCHEKFELDEVKNSPRRELNKNKSYWLELVPTGQHLPHIDQESFWYHVHPQDDLAKRKEVSLDLTKIYATCPVCQKVLHLHSWKEKAENRKTAVFSGIVIEKLPVSFWVEIQIFQKKNVEIWIQDKNEKYWLLSANGQLLPAEKQGDIIICGNELFLDNDYPKALLFIFDDELTQEVIDKHLNVANETTISANENFHLEIPMLEDEKEIPKKPDNRRRSTKELSSGELAGLQTEREQSKEIIVIIDDSHVERLEIPKHHEVDLTEPTPLPEDAGPLLFPENTNDSEDDDPPKKVIPEMIVTTEKNQTSGVIAMPLVTNIGPIANQTFSDKEDQWFAEMDPPTDSKESNDVSNDDIATEETLAITEAPTTTLPTAIPTMTTAETKDNDSVVETAEELYQPAVENMSNDGMPETILEVEKIKNIVKNHNHEAIFRTLFAVGGLAFILLTIVGFAKLINYYQQDDLKAELKTAEKRKMELASQTKKLRAEADLIRFDLMETQQKLESLRNNVPLLRAEQAKLEETLTGMENRLGKVWAWQADVQDFFVKAKNQLQIDFAKLKDETRNDQLAWQKQESERQRELLALKIKQSISFIKQQATPPQTAQKPAKSIPLTVDKSPKDKATPPVDKPKNPQKSAEKIHKKTRKTHSFEAKDLVHVWTGPTYF